AEVIGRLWAMVQKGRNYLDNRLSGDEGQAEAEAVMEEVLGKAWQLTELREKGYFQSDLSLYELAWEGSDDDARQERVGVRHLIDPKEGAVRQAISYRPYKALKFTNAQPSYQQPLQVAEAAVYPGFCNRRVRWDAASEKQQPMSTAVLRQAHTLARPEFESV